ncbi:uncharacterized protein [Triticum aestivum]|uniref:uncharacterized protein n=2 Tax=Triticum TaxID=4564 RepID=UPI00084373BF|nr:uncharacterized protein LOC123161464 [Triticum aestivum]
MPHRCAAVLLCGDGLRRPPKYRERRTRVTNIPNFLTDDVAGLAIFVPRETAQADCYMHAGLWKARGTTQSPRCVATGQRKKSNLKKCREELQLHVVGWFRGRSGWARRLICRGRLLGTSDLADGY